MRHRIAGRFTGLGVRLVIVLGVIVALGACQSTGPRTVAAVEKTSDFRVASFNVHYLAPGQKKLDWDRRKDAVRNAVGDLQADIIAFQEMETFAGGSYNPENRQLDWVLRHFPEYVAGAYGDAKVYPNTQPILFRKARFQQREQGFFFFSETPEVIYSRTFNGSWPAFCSWTRLEEIKTGRQVVVYNLHFEYRSMSNRAKSADLVAERVAPRVGAGDAVVIVGDTNAFSFTPTMRTLRDINLTLAPPSGPTFHLNRGIELLPAIDHVLFSDVLQQIGSTHRLRQRYDGVWPSDHYPVAVDFRFRNP